jgi:hypothetical protein
MLAKPRLVTSYRTPGYPTKHDALRDPALLRDHVPANWLRQRDVAAALGVFLAASAGGCRDAGTADVPRGDVTKAAVVAPIFEHGDGVGPARFALGCIAVAAPTYLPEEVALQIIAEELATVGLVDVQRDMVLSDVRVRGFESTDYEWVSDQHTLHLVPATKLLSVDLVAPGGIAVEYVSDTDFYTFGGNDREGYGRNLKQVAGKLGQHVAAQAHGLHFGVFYDPVEYWRYHDADPAVDKDMDWESEEDVERWFEASAKAWERAERKATEKARELLRQQVQDFVAWLKGQGVI